MALDPIAAPPPADLTPALDFDALRTRALATLQRLAGSTWTDHNAHDPGITLLEQLCYALTDLAYRSGFPVPDLLTGRADVSGDGANREPGLAGGVYGPAQVLPSAAVTVDDLRRLVVDLPGVKNAWIEPLDEPLARHDAAQALLVAVAPAAAGAAAAAAAPASPNVVDVRPRGLYRVRIEKSGLGEDVDGSTLVRLAAQRLQQWRGLGEDVAEIGVLDRIPVALDASIELAPGADGAEVLAAVYQAAAQYMSPALPFRSLRELLERGWRVDQIFEGPLLTRGFLDPAEWAAAGRRSTLRLSDLIRELMAVPGVQAVTSLGFLRDGQVSRDWLLPIAPDRCASFDLDGSRLRLDGGGLRIDHAAMRDSARRLFEARARQAATAPLAEPVDQTLAAPAGRDRQVGRYLSVQHHLPPVYGVGPSGLSSYETVERQAQAQQLKAYLLLFDQLLANQFAQLACAGRLLSFDDVSTEVRFAQPVPDEGGALQIDRLRCQPPAEHLSWLARTTRDPWGDDPLGEGSLARRHRLTDHLLARLGERWTEQRPVAGNDDVAIAAAQDGPPVEQDLSPRQRALRGKQAYLRDYPRLSLRRGVGEDALADPAGIAGANGLAQRLARLLAWPEGDAVLRVVEHILLRPLPADAWQRGPLMRAVNQRDPFSLRLSLVLPAQDARLADPDLRERLEQTVRSEAPAHLALRLVWLDDEAMDRFDAAQARWRSLWRSAQRRRFGVDAAATADEAGDHQVALRSARNRVIDALGLGDTFPLTDLTVADGGAGGPIKVAHGQPARIAIEAAEAGVRYELRGPEGRPLRDAQGQALPPVAAVGADERLVLEGPPVTDDITYRILATKLQPAPGLPSQPPVLLAQGAAVKVGLDTRLAVGLPDLPLLDGTLASAQPTDARLCSHGEQVRVQVHQSQEGVLYALVIDGKVQPTPEIGNLDTIDLRTPPLTEDATIAVQATKRFSGGSGGPIEHELLTTQLRVAVRADPTPALEPLPAAVVGHRQRDARLRLSTSQASVQYQVWVRRVRDAEWRRGADDLADTSALRAGADGPVLQRFELSTLGPVPDGFEAASPDAVAGTGAALELPLGAPADDVVCLVRTTKQHAAGNAVVTTEGLLAAQALVLVRPDPQPKLQLALVQPAAGALPLLRVAGGQGGVYYHFQPATDDAAGGASLPWPAYMHQRAELDPALNKGLDQLAIGVNLAIATDPDQALGGPVADDPRSGDDTLTPERRRPAAPRLDLPSLPDDALLRVRAVKAQTGVEQVLPLQVRLAALPVLRVEPEFPAPGKAAEIQVAAALATERYQLWADGRALAEPAAGDGGPLVLSTGPLEADTRLVLGIEAAAAADTWPLRRELLVDLRLLPRADRPVAARRTSLAPGEATEIVLADSQPGVLYQLLAGDRAVGEAQPGTGGELVLATAALTADTRFTVLARRADREAAAIVLDTVVTVQVIVPAPPVSKVAPAAAAAVTPTDTPGPLAPAGEPPA
ncbi:MAG: hypothetical protein JNL87_11280 [Burkholderiaceae bacterium]|nr:hypothetical protein [Burkholderiaceae bacterium]